jgi:hypothetical protein
MSSPSAGGSSPTSPPEFHFLAAFLSYLIPGLGQIAQGRVGKGLLFFVCVLTLFYYGMYLGNWSNVYLPDHLEANNNPWNLPRVGANLYNRPQFAAQVWVGVAAWPAIFQYIRYDPDAETGPLLGSYQRAPYEFRVLRPDKPVGDDPADRKAARRRENLTPLEALRDYPGMTINEMQTNGDKTWDLGWIFTVIAGVLNVMVIYDALAGPAYVVVAGSERKED